MLKYSLFFLCLINFLTSTSQNGIDFKVNKQLYLKGSSIIIGNTVLGTSSKKAHNSFKDLNDVLNLKYIDVDKDNKTFNSSQAELEIPKNKKIKYAALYWSAVYKYDIGEKKDDGKYILYSEKKESLPDVNNIYFKTPDSNYQPINGQVVFDSKETSLFKETQPYLCYADVTLMLQNTNNTNGVYTVANVKATQGFVSGGGAGGWLLYIIYENEEDSKKYFTTYNGFIGVDKESLTIDFLNFKTNEIGDVKSSILLGALEGDNSFKTDKCAIIDAKNKKFIDLYTKNRKKDNFFNSTITSMDSKKRNPSSKNTLGLDILKMPVPNKNNAILNNNSTKTKLKLSTKKDGFYLFFVAFETEISETFVPPVETETIVVNENPLVNPTIVNTEINKTQTVLNSNPEVNVTANSLDTNKEEETVIRKETEIVEQKNVFNEAAQAETTQNQTVQTKTAQTKTVQTETYLPTKSYILITNVFSSIDNALKWQSKLNNDGYNAQLFQNPENNWYYVYISKGENLITLTEEKKELLKSESFEDLFIKAFYID